MIHEASSRQKAERWRQENGGDTVEPVWLATRGGARELKQNHLCAVCPILEVGTEQDREPRFFISEKSAKRSRPGRHLKAFQICPITRTTASQQSFREFLPKSEVSAEPPDFDINDLFEGKLPSPACYLGPGWRFTEIEEECARKGRRRKPEGLVVQLIRCLYDLDDELRRFHHGVSYADFWSSWQVDRHLVVFAEKVGRGRDLLDLKNAVEAVRQQLMSYAHILRRGLPEAMEEQAQAMGDGTGAASAQPATMVKGDNGPDLRAERASLLQAYKSEGSQRGVRITDKMIAEAASKTWHERTPVQRWKRNDKRCTSGDDLKIRAVLNRKPHLVHLS